MVRCITQEHHGVFIKTVPAFKSGLPFFTFRHADKVIAILQIQFSEDSGFTEPAPKLAHQGQRMLINNSDLVQLSVINS